MGEVDPVSEDCATPIDENCNGVVNEPAAGCVCTPGATASCYGGPAGTSGHGICVDGHKTCDATGKAYLPGCVGEVDPGIEDCSNSIDENCDGTFCTQSLWSHDYGDAKDQSAFDVAVDAVGNSYVVGQMYGSVTFGNLPTLAGNPGNPDAFVAKFDSFGTPIEAFQYGDLLAQLAEGVALDSLGNPVVAGTFVGGIVFGGNLLGGGANTGSGFVAKLDAVGVPVWAKSIATAANGKNVAIHSVAIDASNNVYVAGEFNAAADLGLGSVTPTGSSDAFLVKYDAAGTAKLVKHYGAAGEFASATRVAVDAVGKISLSGTFYGNVVFGPGTSVTGNAGFPHAVDYFVAELDNSGNAVFADSFGNGASNPVRDIKANGTTELIVVGTFSGNLHPSWWAQCPALVGSASAGNSFVVRLNSTSGVCKGALKLSSSAAGGADLSRLAVGPQGDVFVGGRCTDPFDIGISLSCGAGQSPFVLETTSALTPVWSRAYGTTGGRLSGLAVGPGSALWVLVNNSGTVDFGNGPLPTSGLNDVALASIVTR
jgi:hypothetical protein